MPLKLKRYFLFILCFLPVIPLMAQPGNPAPVGGGLFFLVIAGITLGIIKLRKKNN